MRINAKRLADELLPSGFELHRVDSRFGRIHLIRNSSLVGLYEYVVVEHQGRQKEAVYGGVGISITKTAYQKEIGKVEWPLEIAEDKTRLCTIIRSIAKAREWERHLAQCVSGLASELAQRQGPDLLKNTEDIRRAAPIYLDRIDTFASADEQIKRLKAVSSVELVQSARQYASSPIIAHEDAADVYELCCLCILSSQAVVEPDRASYVNQSLFVNRHLVGLIEVVADELLHRYGFLPALE